MTIRKSETTPKRTLRVGLVLCLSAVAASGCASANDDNCSDTPGVVCTWAGTGKLAYDGDGHALTESSFYWPVDLTIDKKLGTYILDWNNHRVRQLQDDGTLQTVIGADFVGDGPPDLSDLQAPGAPGTEVLLNHPTQLVPMPDDTLTLVSWHNHKLRSFDPKTGLVTVACGGAPGFAGDGGPAAKAKINQPTQLVVTENGTQYFVDQRNQVVRTIDPDGIISTLAGTPTMPGFAGDDGPANMCQLSFPTGPNPPPGGGLALDDDNHLYVSDTLNHRIRRIDLETQEITTIAGTGEPGFSGDGGPAIKAKLQFPRKLTIGPDKRLYFGDLENNRIRAIDLKKGTITTVAGNGKAGFFDSDGLPPKEASLNKPTGVTFDRDGAMYIIDTLNSRIRRVVPEDTGSAR